MRCTNKHASCVALFSKTTRIFSSEELGVRCTYSLDWTHKNCNFKTHVQSCIMQARVHDRA